MKLIIQVIKLDPNHRGYYYILPQLNIFELYDTNNIRFEPYKTCLSWMLHVNPKQSLAYKTKNFSNDRNLLFLPWLHHSLIHSHRIISSVIMVVFSLNIYLIWTAGNPRVTPEVTRDVCLLARMMAANLYFSQIEDLMFEVSETVIRLLNFFFLSGY